jgi:hypothetical protein
MLQSLHPASLSRLPITLDRRRAFSRPDPIRNPVPIKFDGVTATRTCGSRPWRAQSRIVSEWSPRISLRSLTLSRPGFLSSSSGRDFGTRERYNEWFAFAIAGITRFGCRPDPPRPIRPGVLTRTSTRPQVRHGRWCRGSHIWQS